jgi:hypothetical protein
METFDGIAADAALATSDLPEDRPAIQKLRYSHEALIDLMITNPEMSQNDLAARFGYTASWISQVITSDAFQARLMERTREVVDPLVHAAVEARLRGTLARSLELLQKKLAVENPTDQLVLRSLELSSRALGYGAREQTPDVRHDVNQHLERLAERMTSLLQHKREVLTIDQPPVESGPRPSIEPIH